VKSERFLNERYMRKEKQIIQLLSGLLCEFLNLPVTEKKAKRKEKCEG
jgi:hypothetical protein